MRVSNLRFMRPSGIHRRTTQAAGYVMQSAASSTNGRTISASAHDMRSFYTVDAASLWVKQLVERYLPLVVEIPIPSRAAGSAGSSAVVNVGILWRKFMAVFAMRLSTLFLGMGLNRCLGSGSGIKRLRAPIGPSAIVRFVVAIIIDPVKGIAMWSRSHVGRKILESLTTREDRSPPLANANTSGAVVFVIGALLVFAALNHVRPSLIERIKGLVAHLPSPFESRNYTSVLTG